jgi:uncharacterized protein (TIGR03437 family)
MSVGRGRPSVVTKTLACAGLWFCGNVWAAAPDASHLLSRLPLRFEADRSSGAGAYVAHSLSLNLTLKQAVDIFEIGKDRVEVQLRGASLQSRLDAIDPLPGTSSYFLGSPEKWRTGVKAYGRVRRTGIYPGIDMIFHGEGGKLEYDFVLAPHSDPSAISLKFRGQRRLQINRDGDLLVATSSGEICWKAPEIFQEAGGVRTRVAGRFVTGTNGVVRFEVGAYDHERTLVIDPALGYSTYLGQTRNEVGRGIAVDSNGNVYIAGDTSSTNLPVRSAYQPTYGGTASVSPFGDAFIAKFSPSGSLLYLTYLGGSGNDGAVALAVDASGNAYVAGATTSTDFPVMNASQPKFGGMGGAAVVRTGDAFVVKLDPTGSQLLYSTYLGGKMDDIATAIAIDTAGNAYVAGATVSPNFPTTASAYQKTLRGAGGEPIRPSTGQPGWEPGDAFVTKFDPSGQVLYSTEFGGTLDDVAFTVALDSAGNVYIGGSTVSTDLPTTANALSRSFGGVDPQNFFLNPGDGFVAEFDGALSNLLYATYFGGNGDDSVTAIAVDSAGAVYIAGSTSTMNLPATSGAFQNRYAGYFRLPDLVEQLYGDAYVVKFMTSSSKPVYLTYLGGSQNDAATALAVDSAGNAYVAGWTDSFDFPTAGGPLQSKLAGDGGQGLYIYYGDAFLSILNPTGTALLYSTYLGGNADDEAYGLALDKSGNIYLTGNTISTNFPTSSGAFQKTFGGGAEGLGGIVYGDAFYAMISGLGSSGPVITTVSNAFGPSTTIAPNTWVAVKGIGLSSTSRAWQGSDFVNNQMPVSLDGVSVTMNGERAYVYYISGTQISVLTPPDLAPGPVQVRVTSGGKTSAVFTAQAQAISPSLFVFDTAGHVVATHLDLTDIGPVSLYPGLTTPAHPGETIILYGNGFGMTTSPVVPGSVSQSGTLPSSVQIQINGVTASYSFAGLVSPGLYQFNVVAPGAGLISGDNTIRFSTMARPRNRRPCWPFNSRAQRNSAGRTSPSM